MATVGRDTDTIVAVATPVGEGAVGIVRLSGPDAVAIVENIFSAKNKKPLSAQKSFTLRYGWIKNGDGQMVDEVIVSLMRSPKSFTREDVVEINSHGGTKALSNILQLVLENGARMAEPGEFTKRAFLNGRLDLTQAEAVLDVIQAKSDLALKCSLSQLAGGVSKSISHLRASILELLADIEVKIDFSEEESGPSDIEGLCGRIEESSARMKTLLDRSFEGRIIREGLKVVICGRTNVGKSSLLNAILKKERAIVTPIAGTTRDTIEEPVSVNGLALRLIDTAGILEHRDDIEKEALSRTRYALDVSELILFVLDASSPLSDDDRRLASELKGRKVVVVLNKCDLERKIDSKEAESLFSQKPVCVSAKNGNRIEELEEAIYNSVFSLSRINVPSVVSEGELVTNARHIEILKSACKCLGQARDNLKKGLSLEFAALDIKKALDTLGTLTGEVFSEELLDVIFSKFCIGK